MFGLHFRLTANRLRGPVHVHRIGGAVTHVGAMRHRIRLGSRGTWWRVYWDLGEELGVITRREGMHGIHMNGIIDSGVSGAIIITIRHGMPRTLCGGPVIDAGHFGTRSRGGRYRVNSAIGVMRAHPLSGSGY